MHMGKKWSGTPRDRRFDRRKVAIAAVAALFLFAASAHASVVTMTVDTAASSLTTTNTVDLSYVHDGVVTSSGQPNFLSGDFVTPVGQSDSYHGYLNVNLDPNTGSIQFLPNSAVIATTQGGYLPSTVPNNGSNSGLSTGIPAPANYGLEVSAIGALESIASLQIDPTPGSAPMALSGGTTGTFEMGPVNGANSTYAPGVGQTWWAVSGFEKLVSPLGSGTTDFSTAGPSDTPFPIPLGTAAAGGSLMGTWDGTTLTIPVQSVLTFVLGSDAGDPAIGGFPDTITWSGTLVFHPAPEPSTLTLCGLGVVGLMSYAWRARKRRPLVA